MQNSRTNQTQQSAFIDLDATFNLSPATNDLVLSKDVQAVNRALKNLLLTKLSVESNIISQSLTFITV